MKPEYSLAYVPIDDDIRVDVAVGCGKRFEGVAWILQYASENPSLRIEKGLGIAAVKEVVAKAEGGFVR
jgi:hypothetical protein